MPGLVEVRVPDDQYRYTDPATTQLPHVRYGDPRHNPIAFLPVADAAPEGRVDFHGAVDWAWPSDGEDAQVAVPPRVDDWCEDRAHDELSDQDWFD